MKDHAAPVASDLHRRGATRPGLLDACPVIADGWEGEAYHVDEDGCEGETFWVAASSALG